MCVGVVFGTYNGQDFNARQDRVEAHVGVGRIWGTLIGIVGIGMPIRSEGVRQSQESRPFRRLGFDRIAAQHGHDVAQATQEVLLYIIIVEVIGR